LLALIAGGTASGAGLWHLLLSATRRTWPFAVALVILGAVAFEIGMGFLFG
jgi:hypothetical protein